MRLFRVLKKGLLAHRNARLGLYVLCTVVVASRWRGAARGVHVDVRIEEQSHAVDVRKMSLCCALQRAENAEVRKS
jgi:hypothetical protein